MGGLLTALNAGKTSLLVNQKSIEVVGNNIANVNTEGYSRQSAELSQIPALNFGQFFVGQGVAVTDIKRDYDVFISRQLQDKSISFGEESGRSAPLTELERVFNVSGENLSSEIDRFFDSWQELTANPSGEVERDVVIQRGELLGVAFANTYQELDTVRENMNTTIIANIENLNEKISEIARLNDRIALVETTGQTANAARDSRDLLIQNLSQTLGIQTHTDNRGMISVNLPGGLPLVQGNMAMQLEAVTTGTDVSLQVRMGNTVKPLTLENMGGEFRGIFEIRDVFMGGLYDEIDALAIDITSAVNDVHDDGYYIDPTSGLAATGQLFFADLAGPPPTENASRHIQVIVPDSRYIAAAGQSTAAPGDNETALRIADLENTHFVVGTNDTFDNYFSKIVAGVGIEAGRNDLALGGAEDAMVQLHNLREGTVGVSLEEEMINLMQFQRGFESSAKFLSTVDEMLETLLALKR